VLRCKKRCRFGGAEHDRFRLVELGLEPQISLVLVLQHYAGELVQLVAELRRAHRHRHEPLDAIPGPRWDCTDRARACPPHPERQG